MNDSKNLTIALLTVTAAILLSAVFVVYSDSATASTAESRAGDYSAVTGSISSSTDLLFLIDVGSQRLNGYMVNRNTGAVELVNGATVDLRMAFEGGGQQRGR